MGVIADDLRADDIVKLDFAAGLSRRHIIAAVVTLAGPRAIPHRTFRTPAGRTLGR
jgi:hypothetical protein